MPNEREDRDQIPEQPIKEERNPEERRDQAPGSQNPEDKTGTEDRQGDPRGVRERESLQVRPGVDLTKYVL